MNAALKEKTLREQVKLPQSNQVCQLMLTLAYLWSPLQQALNQPWHPYPVLNAIDVINSDTCLGNVLKTRTNNGHQPLCLFIIKPNYNNTNGNPIPSRAGQPAAPPTKRARRAHVTFNVNPNPGSSVTSPSTDSTQPKTE